MVWSIPPGMVRSMAGRVPPTDFGGSGGSERRMGGAILPPTASRRQSMQVPSLPAARPCFLHVDISFIEIPQRAGLGRFRADRVTT